MRVISLVTTMNRDNLFLSIFYKIPFDQINLLLNVEITRSPHDSGSGGQNILHKMHVWQLEEED